MKKQIISGDISSIESDALITAVNSSGMWFGGIDGVIRRAAGNFFHQQLASNLSSLSDGKAFFAPGEKLKHQGKFKNVIFVIDDLQMKLHQIVLEGLKEAEKRQTGHVTIPTIRMGVMLGVVEKTEDEALEQIAMAIRVFEKSNPTFVKQISFVVYQNQALEKGLAKKIS